MSAKRPKSLVFIKVYKFSDLVVVLVRTFKLEKTRGLNVLIGHFTV